MQITIDYEQGKFIRNHAAARIKNAMQVLREPYRRQFLAHMPEKHYEEVATERRAEINMLRELIHEVCQYCNYHPEGVDTDGTKWYRCDVHDEAALSPDAPCGGYIGEPYELKLSKEV